MRLRDLERALATVPPHPAPRLELEQYATPASLAARLLAEADALGDVAGRRVADLGCGTGILAIGAALVGAEDVLGVDVDAGAVDVARGAAARLGARARFEVGDVASWRGAVDTVVMNPPFGAQVRGADRAFLQAAFASAGVVYSLHHAETRAFVESAAARAGFAVSQAWLLRFPLPQTYRHQSRASVEIDVIAFRMTKTRESVTSET